MKRIICIFVLFLFTFSLASCKKERPTAFSAASEINTSLSLGARVYSSTLGETDEGYISEQMREAFFDELPLPSEYAVVIGSRFDKVCEIGIFYADGEVSVPDCIEVAKRRLKLLSDLSSGEALTVRYGDTVVYAYLEDVDAARRALDGVFA